MSGARTFGHRLMRVALTPAAFAACTCVASPAIAAGGPRLPTELIGTRALEVRPHAVGITGDGTGYLGGFTSRASVPRPSRADLNWAGQIRWTSWGDAQARGAGALWLNSGIPDDAEGTFTPHSVTIRAFRPRAGVFTRMTLRYRVGGRLYDGTLRATYYPGSGYGPGYWAW